MIDALIGEPARPTISNRTGYQIDKEAVNYQPEFAFFER